MNTHAKNKQRGFERLMVKVLVGNYGFIILEIVIAVAFNRLYAVATLHRCPSQVVVVQPRLNLFQFIPVPIWIATDSALS